MKRIKTYTDCCIKFCRHPNHNPPNMIVLQPGEYEHECPKCGYKQNIIIPLKPNL